MALLNKIISMSVNMDQKFLMIVLMYHKNGMEMAKTEEKYGIDDK
jgi:hypothetical protein